MYQWRSVAINNEYATTLFLIVQTLMTRAICVEQLQKCVCTMNLNLEEYEFHWHPI